MEGGYSGGKTFPSSFPFASHISAQSFVGRSVQRLQSGEKAFRQISSSRREKEGRRALLKFLHFAVDSHFNSSKLGSERAEKGRGRRAELEDSKAILRTKVPASSHMRKTFKAHQVVDEDCRCHQVINLNLTLIKH